MPDPISTDDLYGPSNPPVPEGSPATPISIPIEETPEITVEPTPPPPAVRTTPPPPPSPAPKSNGVVASTLGLVIMFIGLFGVGVWLSSFVRQYFPNGLTGETKETEVAVNTPIPTPTPDPYVSWKTYQVVSGTTKLPIEGISYKLPAEIVPPSCDNVTCISQGTYLPGGTRLTVAPRGTGQLLADFRGSAISDVSGTVFTTEETTVNGRSAKLFTGSIAGRTVGGYAFTQMRGIMIEMTPTLSLELNHFTPTGVIVDFAVDDTLFDLIVSSVGGIDASPATPAVTQTVPATSSGF